MLTTEQIKYKKKNLNIYEKKFIERAATEIINKVPDKILGKHKKDFIIRLTKDEKFIEKCLIEIYKDETN